MFLPLGFGGKLKKWPLLTLGICFTLVVIHVRWGAEQAQMYQDRWLHESVALAHTDAFEAHYIQNCEKLVQRSQTYSQKPEQCQTWLNELRSSVFKSDSEASLILIHSIVAIDKHIQNKGIHAISTGMQQAWKEFEAKIGQLHSETGYFSKKSGSIVSIFQSIFLHASWSHLLSNIFILFFVGALVEQRRNRWIMATIYILGGIVGAYASLNLNPSRSVLTAEMGASGAIMTVAGLFSAYYWRFRMKFLFFVFPPFYKTFYASTLAVIPLAFFAQDILGYMSTLFDVEGSSVSYLAHLGGAFFGLSVGLAQEKYRAIPWPYIYDSEKYDMRSVEKLRDPNQRVVAYKNILNHNPENISAAKFLCSEIAGQIRKSGQVEQWMMDDLQLYMPTVLSVCMRKGFPEQGFTVLLMLPYAVDLHQILDRSNEKVIRQAIAWAEKKNRWIMALRLFDVWSEKFSEEKFSAEAYGKAVRMVSSISNDNTVFEKRILDCLSHFKNKEIQTLLHEKYKEMNHKDAIQRGEAA